MHRIAYFAHTSDIGGPNNSLMALLSALDRERFEPIIYFPSPGPTVDQLSSAGEQCRVVPWDLIQPSRGWSRALIYARDLCHGTLSVRQALKRDRIDLVHINTSVTPYPGLAARSLALPVVWHVREILRRTTKHDWYISLVFRLATQVVTVSDAVRQRLLPRAKQSSMKMHVIANGIDLLAFDRLARPDTSRAALGLPDSRKVIALPGSFQRQHKGHEVMLEAASLLLHSHGVRDFYIVLIGEETLERGARPLTRWLRDYCCQHGLTDHVLFAGFRLDLPALLTHADIVCQPSICEDAFPRGVLEGMAAGKPVVASDVGGIPEMVVHDRTGILVPPGRADLLAAALADLICDESKAARFGQAGRARVEAQFTSQAHASRIESLYGDILAPC